tara:strand:- start:2524 stop:3354 length:831 start_codon:yes stop_codon:yes gene_type:complete
MFGLEGTGFTISVAVTLLLAGLVAFYCKQRLDEMDKKFEGLLNLNKALANSQAVIEQRMIDQAWNRGGNNSSPPNLNTENVTSDEGLSDTVKESNETDDRTVVSDGESSENSDSDSESESDSDSDDGSNGELDSDNVEDLDKTSHVIIGSEIDNVNSLNDGIKVVELSQEKEDSSDSNLKEPPIAVNLEEIELETPQDIEDLEESSDSEESSESEEDSENKNNEWIKKIVTQEVKDEVDVKKLNVNALRELVVTKNLADINNAKKLKKKELIELLS